MSLFNIMNIAGTGLNAQNLRLNITASNLSNAESVASTEKKAYKARHPVFLAYYNNVFDTLENPGVKMQAVVESSAEHLKRYEPDNPIADTEGYVYQSNVNPIEEMTNMIVASRNYQNNVEMINTSKEMLLATLRIGQ